MEGLKLEDFERSDLTMKYLVEALEISNLYSPKETIAHLKLPAEVNALVLNALMAFEHMDRKVIWPVLVFARLLMGHPLKNGNKRLALAFLWTATNDYEMGFSGTGEDLATRLIDLVVEMEGKDNFQRYELARRYVQTHFPVIDEKDKGTRDIRPLIKAIGILALN